MSTQQGCFVEQNTTAVDRALAFIDDSYAKLASLPDFRRREAQPQLSKAIALSFLQSKPLLAEAPTGTGKTLAYLVGSLAAADVTATSGRPKPVIVSTATKALQSQVVSNDLPNLFKIGLLTQADVVIAKGRGNYFCASGADQVIAAGEIAEISEGSAREDDFVRISADDVVPMLDSFESGFWDGDFDSYMGYRPVSLDAVKASVETCNGMKCPRYQNCAFYNMKRKMPHARVIVANHNLVLLDLMMAAEDVEPNLPVDNYLSVFDEAHHLPGKALEVGSSNAYLTALQVHLTKLKFFRKELLSAKELPDALAGKELSVEDFGGVALTRALDELVNSLQSEKVDEQSQRKRYAGGRVPERLAFYVKAMVDELLPFYRNMTNAVSALQVVLEADDASESAKKSAREALLLGVKLNRALKESLRGLSTFVGPDDVVKWLHRTDKGVSLHTSPLEGSVVLKPLLWDAARATAVLVSATLRDVDGFKRFAKKCGIPEHHEELVLPYSFPYEQSRLTVAPMRASPKPIERKAFVQELSMLLPASIREDEGTLILFPSRKLMNELGPVLKMRFGGSTVALQGEDNLRGQIEVHQRRIRAGKGSILCGLQTMAEGLDLPGDLCTHVGIIALPFSVPTDPVEEEIAERLGDRYFMERALPDATLRLIQMAGRLLRRETDSGRITVFDHRIASTRYGHRMLKALPPFEVVIERA
ncbi:hypothetical protein F6X40_17250 [Paraburkholderia sp. UCT31]|uniref:helicase C-terminal domain-containing protein n=1 Tax=Paraburkholderia sp. UCT31 TaxID=2615209 RepID=UPI0016563D5F|nr:helicase C-terminal domain-containing protein [Paraburkholderia sp. UCT31]MBC8738522.1 hypothetical protein [Paraburkholderia sp. UCT31]